MSRSYKFETIGGAEIESRIFPLGREPDLKQGDIISIRYSHYDFSLIFEATEDEVIETVPDEEAVKYEETATLETDTTTKYETKGTFYVVDDDGQHLLGAGIWYAHENRTTFFDVEDEDTTLYRLGELPYSIKFNDILDYETYWEIRHSRQVDHIVHSRFVDSLADSSAAV